VACVASRAFLHGAAVDALFCCAGTQGMLPLALVPGADMFNHGGGAGGARCDSEWTPDGAYEVRAAARLAPGEELLISYGDRPARDCLENYGFVPPPGANAAEALALDAAPLALAACGGCGCGCGAGAAPAARDGPLAPLLAALPPAGGGAALRARRAALLGEATGLAPHAAELELPLAHADGCSGGAGDALRVLRALCWAPVGAGAPPSAAALEAPLSRGNEALSHVALAALVANAFLGAYWESGGEGSCGGGAPAGAAAVQLGADGVPLLSAPAGGALATGFGALAALAAAAGAAAEGGAGADGAAVTAMAVATAATVGALVALLREVVWAEEDVWEGLQRAPQRAPPGRGEGAGGAPWEGAEAALGCGTEGCGADRALLAAAYRRVRARGLLLYAEHAGAMLRVAAGKGGGGAPVPPPPPPQPPPTPRFCGARLCLEVQEPWVGLLMSGAKTIETRAYALPSSAVGQPIALLRTPPGGSAAHGLASGALVGWTVFRAPARYPSREAWAADAHAHGVVEGAPGAEAFGWEEHAEKWSWPVASVRAAAGPGLPVRLTEALRWKRSIFALPFAAGCLAGEVL
jgi:hypothetical protein